MYTFHHGPERIMRVQRGIIHSRPCWNVLSLWLWSTVCSARDVRVCDKQTRDTFQPSRLTGSEIMCGYTTADTVLRERRTK